MRFLYFSFLLLLSFNLSAQEKNPTAVFSIVESMPRFPGCENQGLAADAVKKCSEKKMLGFVYENISYPEEAKSTGIEGTVVIRFVIQEDGGIAEAQIAKEIGGGCGAEALRVVELMNEKGIKWIPGMQEGKPVRVYFNLPVKYKLEKEPPPPLPYFIAGVDTIYTEFEEAPVYGTEEGALQKYMENLPYPQAVDSCLAGSMVVQFFISKKGEIKIGDIYDYGDLGFDFQFEAIQHLNATNLKWQPAKRGGLPVSCYLPLRMTFKPKTEKCQTIADNYDLAYIAAAEAETLYTDQKIEEAISKWTASLTLLPGNAEVLLLRGQAYLEVNQNEKACTDLQAAKKIIPLAAWVEQLLPMICN